MPDVNDERVAVIADGIQSSGCADVACIPSEATKHSLDDARTLQKAGTVKRSKDS